MPMDPETAELKAATTDDESSEAVGEKMELRPGLTKTVQFHGKGEKPEQGRLCTLHYHGTLADGTVFDSTAGKSPFTFHLHSGEVIIGWDIAVSTMRVGERATFVIPPEYVRAVHIEQRRISLSLSLRTARILTRRTGIAQPGRFQPTRSSHS